MKFVNSDNNQVSSDKGHRQTEKENDDMKNILS